ncbi:MAG: hypothetical protein ACRCZJ_06235 [Erysipelotrichaceae bacterium]
MKYIYLVVLSFLLGGCGNVSKDYSVINETQQSLKVSNISIISANEVGELSVNSSLASKESLSFSSSLSEPIAVHLSFIDDSGYRITMTKQGANNLDRFTLERVGDFYVVQ